MIKNLLGGDSDPAIDKKSALRKKNPTSLSLFDTDSDESETTEKEEFVLSTAEPESFAETTRRSGLAWSAGIVFFASIVFMLVLGWGADLLFGSSPWGIVAGIVLGSLIGFIQFFRLTSQIFTK
ncbi:MAG: AtpZ/AtpI family protein [Acidobacteriota bacterium]|jgi:F0F1-type ATP synthase assembly protein I|nr:AtpZ/AtpI family protein [Acidobacteriota bacterium]